MRRFLGVMAVLALYSCNAEKESMVEIKTGQWRAVLEIQGRELPFNFDLERDDKGGLTIYIKNAEERILLDEVTLDSDSINIGLHIFDANIKAQINGDTMRGMFIKNYEKDYKIPFQAVYGQNYRFEKSSDTTEIPDFNGKYDVTFISDSVPRKAIGIFKQVGDSVTGTFLTPTGDYRYLQGNVANGMMQLSTFDGNHAFLFTAIKKQDGTLSGEYLSGKTRSDTWTGIRNEDVKMADPESLTYLKKGYDRIEFSFPDLTGKKISLNDEKYRNKVVILQLFGTWCPNCMDETKFLSQWYKDNKERGVEIVGLAYERKADFNYASDRVRKMTSKMNVDYDIVIAGTNDNAKASETLPMLNKVAAFPTTIYIGKDGKVRKIHTGFSGPGTGIYYDQFVQQFNEIVNELLFENAVTKNN